MIRNLIWILFTSAVSGAIFAIIGFIGILVAKYFFNYYVSEEAVMYFFWVAFCYNIVKSFLQYDKLFEKH